MSAIDTITRLYQNSVGGDCRIYEAILELYHSIRALTERVDELTAALDNEPALRIDYSKLNNKDDPKPRPSKEEVVNRYLDTIMTHVWEMTDEKLVTDQVKRKLSDLYDEAQGGKG
jgi:hypothetical protein